MEEKRRLRLEEIRRLVVKRIEQNKRPVVIIFGDGSVERGF